MSSKKKDLIKLAANGRLQRLKAAIEAGSDPDEENDSGETPLYWAALKGHAEIVSVLIEAGANPNHIDSFKQTPLSGAASAPTLGTFTALLEGGADANTVAPTGDPILCALAADNSNKDVVAALISAGANPDSFGPSKKAPLHWAAGSGAKGIVLELLVGGADPNGPPGTGIEVGESPPISLAFENGHKEVVAALIAAGANADTLTSGDTKEQQGSTVAGQTTLHVLAGQGNAKAAKAMLDAMSEKDASDAVLAKDKARRTPITVARATEHRRTTALLRSYIRLPWWKSALFSGLPWLRLLFLTTQLGAFALQSAGGLAALPSGYSGIYSFINWTLGLGWFPELQFSVMIGLLIPTVTLMNTALLVSPHSQAFSPDPSAKSIIASAIVIFWGLLGTVLLVPVFSALASVADCTCSAGVCTLDAIEDGSYVCWTVPHVALVAAVFCVSIGLLASVGRIVQVGYDARALETVKIALFDVDSAFSLVAAAFSVVFFVFIPVFPIVALTGWGLNAFDEFQLEDSQFFGELSRERFLTQADSLRWWQGPLLVLRLFLTLIAVVASNYTSAVVLFSFFALLIMAGISLLVPVYEDSRANALNAGIHFMVLWVSVAVMIGQFGSGYPSIGTFLIVIPLAFIYGLGSQVGLENFLFGKRKKKKAELARLRSASVEGLEEG